MNPDVFKAFVKIALAHQCDEDTPESYLLVKAAVAARFPDLIKTAGIDALELAGLGTLAAPAASGLMGRHWSEKNKERAEVAGLGMLAAPYAHNIAARRIPSYASSRIGQRLSRFFKH